MHPSGAHSQGRWWRILNMDGSVVGSKRRNIQPKLLGSLPLERDIVKGSRRHTGVHWAFRIENTIQETETGAGGLEFINQKIISKTVNVWTRAAEGESQDYHRDCLFRWGCFYAEVSWGSRTRTINKSVHVSLACVSSIDKPEPLHGNSLSWLGNVNF